MNRFWRRSASPPTPLPTQPSCEQVGQVLQAYVDGELGPADTERVVAHLEHCHRCGTERAVLDQVIVAIRRQRPDLDVRAVVGRLERFVIDLETTQG